jgi:hypothetical protein
MSVGVVTAYPTALPMATLSAPGAKVLVNQFVSVARDGGAIRGCLQIC